MVDIDFEKIKLVLTDIDGVWTNAKFYYTKDGFFQKAFSTYDGMAVSLLRKFDIETVIISSENCMALKARAKKLNIKHLYIGEENKLQRAYSLCEIFNLELENMAFIGDDLNDLDLLKKVGFSCMPPNSPILNIFTPHYITKKAGGEGAFREFVDVILSHK